ncbi:hypothetical protein LTR36_004177 [Oleoguttula mirabilis]|uniref:rRNA-processing protein FYV7 n=1 Tax=Oleoguttula mirabilis TaxID=1507867 RepID=A0AAV9JI01_9PEZI|nr:hypothetical protein LTR36_004177 [Oleoguttula mirabilis]
MAEKRKHEGEGAAVVDYRPGKKKQKGGFRVGPANLPDGVYKRKTQKIKESLIERAQIKKNYAKLKKQGKIQEEPEGLPQPASLAVEEQPEPSAAPHPDRQTLIDKVAEAPAEEEPAVEAGSHHEPRPRRERKPKTQPFKHEHEDALKRKAQAEEWRKAREEAEQQRQQKIAERERFRKAMAKARTGGPNGQRKLGRESQVLLERVKRMVGEDG